MDQIDKSSYVTTTARESSILCSTFIPLPFESHDDTQIKVMASQYHNVGCYLIGPMKNRYGYATRVRYDTNTAIL